MSSACVERLRLAEMQATGPYVGPFCAKHNRDDSPEAKIRSVAALATKHPEMFEGRKANGMVVIVNRTYTSLLNASQDLKGLTDPICVVTMKQVNTRKTEVQTKTRELNLERKKSDICIDQLKKITNESATTVLNANKAIKTTRANTG